MSQTTLLECREAAAAQNHANGDWQTVLNAPQMLMPGDQVILKTAAVDTRKATTGTITLENDVSATISGYPYVVNYEPTGKSYASGGTACDFKRYYGAKLITRPSASTYKTVTSITLQGLVEPFGRIDKCTITANFTGPPVTVKNTIVNEAPADIPAGNFFNVVTPNIIPVATSEGYIFIQSTKVETATFSVTGMTKADQQVITEVIQGTNMLPGQPTFATNVWYSITAIQVTGFATTGIITVGTMSADVPNATALISIPELKAKGSETHNVTCALHVANSVEGKDVTFSNIPYQSATNNPPRPGTFKFAVVNVAVSSATTSDGYFEPVELSHNFIIPAGTYSTDALSTAINISITRNKAESTAGTTLLENDMLKTSKYLGASETLFMVREDDSSDPEFFTFNNDDANGSWIGCSTIQLGINSSTNCFEWQYLHTPYYDSQKGDASTGNPAILYEQRTNKYFSTSAMMGIALTTLTPNTFWKDQLGFDTDFATYTHGTIPRTLGTNIVGVRFPTFNVAIGTSTTAQFVGTDSVVTKTSTPGDVPTLPSNNNAQGRHQLVDTANLDNFLPVKAPIAYTTLAKDTTGYFLLDVQTNFRTEIVGSTDTSRTIQAIVGRFYNTGSFTIAGSDSGLVYQHVGAPQMIQSLSIRILHPDGTLADDVGNDSTLYFEIQRQIK